MDRNREARRAAASMAGAPNGLSRRRHRSSSLRDSPEEDGLVELQEPARLRDRGLKKDRERDRDRDGERERTCRSSKRRRGERLMNGGDDSSSEEESVNDEEDDEDDVDVPGGAFTRMLPPLPNPVVSAAPPPPSISTNHNHSHHHHHHRKSFPQPTAAKAFKAAAVPAWKAADEMIGVSVPRKARSASTKRSHDWISGGGGEQMIHRQASTSPVRHGLVSSTPSPAAGRDAPLSPPSSSNASVRKKIKPNGGGAKPRPPPKLATTSKSSSSNNNPEELEIEIAEVLYGLMTQSQAPKNDSSSKLELNNKSSSDAKSRVSSPVSSSSPSTSILPQNSSSSAAPLSAAALKRKKPRQVADNNLMGSFSTRSSPVMKIEIDQTPRNEISSPNLERNSGSAAETGDSLAEAKNQSQLQPLKAMRLEATVLSESKVALTEEAGESRDVVLAKEEVNSLKKESTAVKLNDNIEDVTVTSTVTATKVISAVSEIESKREEKFQIDLMAPPPQLRASPERDGAIDFPGYQKRVVVDMEKMGEMIKDKEDNKVGKTSKEETAKQLNDKRAKVTTEEVELQNSSINKERNIDLQFDLEKPDREINKLLPHQVPKSQLLSPKATLREEQPRTHKVAQPSSLPLPMSVTSWPGGLPPPLGYMAPLQGVVSMDGSAMSSAPIQPLFSQPRPKRCATHYYIARNINCYQQLMKMNPFWPAAAGSPSVFGAKPCNLNVMPSSEPHGNVAGRSVNSVQDKGQSLAIFPGHAGKDKVPQPANIPDSAQRKQQILLQQALPPVAPSNILHGPAFIFPFNQQQAAVAAVSARPASTKSPTNTGSLASSSPTVITSAPAPAPAPAPAAATGLSLNYTNMPANETQYLVLQNNPYPFPIPAVGGPPNFGGTHAQPMPMFNGSFYPSQMIHPSQLQQLQLQPSQQQQIQQAHQNTSSGSTSSQKHLLQSQQQRPQGSAINGGGTGGGNLQNFPAPKNRSSQHLQQHQNQHITPPQECQLESEIGGEDTPSTADSRLSRATMNIYSQNFAMPIRPQNFALMTSSDALAGASQNDKQQQHHHQHQVFKAGVESLPPQAFAMSFGPINGSTSASGIDISSMAQNHAILQSLPEATRQSYHQIMQAAAAAQVAQQKKNSRMSEDGKSGGGDSSNADEERKVIAGKAPASSGEQSIAFSRPDLTDTSGSALPGNTVVDSSARTLNLASGPTRMPSVMGTVGTPNSHLQAQFQHHQQQQIMQLHNQHQHQQQLAAQSKMPATSNGSAYSEHLISSSSIAAKFPNSLSGYPPNFVQSSNTSSPAQSPQWKNSTRTPTSQVQSSLTSSTSSLKNHPQQQQTRTQQSHTQISFGSNQKPSASQGQLPPNSSSQSPSPPVVVGSPTHSSISKGASASPRTTTASTNKSGQASTMSSQQAKNTSSIPSQKSSPVGGRNVPSILGNTHITSSSSCGTKTQIQLQQQQQHQQLQQQLSKQTLQQALFFSNPYLQAQPPNSSSSNASAASGYYLQRRRPEQMQQSQQLQGTTASSSTGMSSLCTPVTLSSTSTNDPAKAVAAAAAAAAAVASNMKGGGLSSQGTLHAAQFGAQSSGNPHQLLPVGFSYGHSVPAAVQVKPAEQKQPAGE